VDNFLHKKRLIIEHIVNPLNKGLREKQGYATVILCKLNYSQVKRRTYVNKYVDSVDNFLKKVFACLDKYLEI